MSKPTDEREVRFRFTEHGYLADQEDHDERAETERFNTWMRKLQHDAWQEGYNERTRTLETWYEPSSAERMYWPDSENPYRKDNA